MNSQCFYKDLPLIYAKAKSREKFSFTSTAGTTRCKQIACDFLSFNSGMWCVGQIQL